MHPSISSYLSVLADKGRSPLTVKAARGDLLGFATWWEARLSRPFDPALLRPNDLHTWRLARQKDDAAAPATINRALVTLRAYCDWAKHEGLITDNPVEEIKAIPTSQPVPKSLPAEAIDAILRAVRGEKDERIRLRDGALLALLIYTGLRAGSLRCAAPRSRPGWRHRNYPPWQGRAHAPGDAERGGYRAAAPLYVSSALPCRSSCAWQ